MKTISFTEAKNDLKAILDGVVNDENVTVITRCGAEDVARLLQQPYGNRLFASLAEKFRASTQFHCAVLCRQNSSMGVGWCFYQRL